MEAGAISARTACITAAEPVSQTCSDENICGGREKQRVKDDEG